MQHVQKAIPATTSVRNLQKAYGKEIDKNRVTEVKEISGKGVTAQVDGRLVAAGNGKLMDQLGVPYTVCNEVGTLVYVAVDGRFAGCILISDLLKTCSKSHCCFEECRCYQNGYADRRYGV